MSLRAPDLHGLFPVTGLTAMRILVVDDVGLIRRQLDHELTRHGHTSISVASAREALSLLKQDTTIDVVLTDLLMPGMDGIELFKVARTIDRFNDAGPVPPPPFILITAVRRTDARSKEAEMLKQADDLGFLAVMQKPVDYYSLLSTLATIQTGKSERFESAVAEATVDRALRLVRSAIQDVANTHDRFAVDKLRREMSTELARLSEVVTS
jgi:CheY-like chemotaxis protein